MYLNYYMLLFTHFNNCTIINYSKEGMYVCNHVIVCYIAVIKKCDLFCGLLGKSFF